ELRTIYRNQDFCRGLRILAKRCERPVYANGRVSFAIELPPQATWHGCLLYGPCDRGLCLQAPKKCISSSDRSVVGRRLAAWRKSVLKIHTSNEEFFRIYRQAVEDMAALRLPIENTDPLRFVPAAGIPWFVALFGRDSLLASLQNALVYPDFACATLDVLARFQATEVDDYRDAQPGKIMH